MPDIEEQIRQIIRDDRVDHLADTLYDVHAIARELIERGIDPIESEGSAFWPIVEQHRKPGH